MLDCPRLYEASAAGAIPIVVGDHTEIDATFGTPRPPWLFSPDWEHAARAVRDSLHAGPAVVQERTRAVAEWWRRTVEELRGLVAQYDRAQRVGELGRLVHQCHRDTSLLLADPSGGGTRVNSSSHW